MDYKQFIQDELSEFRLILIDRGVSGDEWRKYMAVKMRLLRGQFCFLGNPLWKTFKLKAHPLLRIRNGNIVWHGHQPNDTLTKVSVNDFNRLAGAGKFDAELTPVTASVLSGGKITVCFPSDNPAVFRPSVECVFQQLPDRLTLTDLLFEVRLSSDDAQRCYDHVLKCHLATVELYYYSYSPHILATRDRELPSPEPEDLNVRTTPEVNKVREPEKPNKVIRTPQRLR